MRIIGEGIDGRALASVEQKRSIGFPRQARKYAKPVPVEVAVPFRIMFPAVRTAQELRHDTHAEGLDHRENLSRPFERFGTRHHRQENGKTALPEDFDVPDEC
jgi:hypothetical protein